VAVRHEVVEDSQGHFYFVMGYCAGHHLDTLKHASDI